MLDESIQNFIIKSDLGYISFKATMLSYLNRFFLNQSERDDRQVGTLSMINHIIYFV